MGEEEGASEVGQTLEIQAGKMGEVHSINVEVPTNGKVNLHLKLPQVPEDGAVRTEGYHTWSGVNADFTGRGVGMKSIVDATKGGKTAFVVEPGLGGEKIPEGTGRSFGCVDFRWTEPGVGTRDTFVGLIPDFIGLDHLEFTPSRNGKGMDMILVRDFGGVGNISQTEFKVFVSSNRYSEAVIGFSDELEKLVGEIKPYQDQADWFSWAAYGKGVKEAHIRSELEAIRSNPDLGKAVTAMVIDDGWEATLGQWEFDRKKFPDPEGLIAEIKVAGIKPGIWVSPFMADRSAQVYKNHPEWFIKDKKGKHLAVSIPQIQPTGEINPIARSPYGLDISIPEVREYLFGEMERLAGMGFEVFKLDYLSVIFTGELTHKDKTPVQYYREFINESRRRMSEKLGKPVELIGCGAPMFESIGLFEGIRVSMDSALPNLGSVVDMLKKLGKVKIDENMYLDAAATAFKRVLIFGKVLGLMLDGVHLNDPRVNVSSKLKTRLKLAFPALKGIGGLSNLFIGDSMVNVDESGRSEWAEFLNKFKMGY